MTDSAASGGNDPQMNADKRRGNPDECSSSSAQSASSADSPSSPPIPPRYRWLKRLLLGSACLLVALVLLRVWWGHHAQSLLDAEIASYRAAGQLVFASEFDELLDAIPDEDNVAMIYEEALTAHLNVITAPEFDYWMKSAQRIAQDPDPVRKLIEANAAVFDLIRQARERERVNWSTKLEGLMWRPSPNPYGQMRSVAKLLAVRAAWQFHTGDHADAIETFEDALKFGEAMEADPLLLSSLVAWGCHALTFSSIGEHSAALRIEGATETGSDHVRPASRASVETLIKHLLDESRSRQSFVRMWYGERAVVLSYLDFLTPGAVPGGAPVSPGTVVSFARDKLTLPLIKTELVRAARFHTLMADRAAMETWPDSVRALDSRTEEESFMESLTQFLGTIVASPLASALDMFHRLVAWRRMAAIALAIRLYEIDHGQRPADLALLVPDYLPAVPVDPFAPDSAPLRHIRDLEPPILYTVWKDGEDNRGKERNESGLRGRRWWVGTDRTLYLGPNPNDED